MIDLTSGRVHVFLLATDMRKSFDTLAAIVSENGLDPLSGDLYVFTNKRKNRIKILLWEKDGFWISAKRLEQGTVAIPLVADGNGSDYQLEIDLTELRLLIEGIELRQIKKSKRFDKKNLQR